MSLYFDSRTLQGGIFGPAWRAPQLESFVARQGGHLTWNTPWGERLKFDGRFDEPVRGEKGSWKLAFAQDGFPRLTVFQTASGACGCSFLYRDGLLRRIEREELPALIFEYAGRSLIRISCLSSTLLELKYEKGRVIQFNECQVSYGNAKVGILSSDGTRVAATRVLPVLQDWIDEREKTQVHMEYAPPDYLPHMIRAWLPGYPQTNRVRNEPPYRRDFERFDVRILMEKDEEWLCLSGRYRKNGLVIGDVSIINENEREGQLKFRLEKGDQADFQFRLPLPKVDAITWNGNIVSCGASGKESFRNQEKENGARPDKGP